MTEQKNLCKLCGKKELLLKDIKGAPGKEPEKEQKLFRCSRCLDALYCSRECQHLDWPEHKKTCMKKDYQFPKTKHGSQTPEAKQTLPNNTNSSDEKSSIENKISRLPIDEENYFRKCLTAMGRKHLDTIFKIGEDRKESICAFMGSFHDISKFVGSSESNLDLALQLGHNPFDTTEVLDTKDETIKAFSDYIKEHVPTLSNYNINKRYCVYTIIDESAQYLYLSVICKDGDNYSVTLTKNSLARV